MATSRLLGRRIFVAGGTGDVGEGILRQLLLAGATVVVPARSETKLAHLHQAYANERLESSVANLSTVGEREAASTARRFPSLSVSGLGLSLRDVHRLAMHATALSSARHDRDRHFSRRRRVCAVGTTGRRSRIRWHRDATANGYLIELSLHPNVNQRTDAYGGGIGGRERFALVQEGIHKHCQGINIQFSTGGRSGAGKERGAHLKLQPDMGSLAIGSVNFPTRVYDNSSELVDWLASETREHQIKPEVEAFDLSMICQAAEMAADGRIDGLLHVELVTGIRNAMLVDCEVFDFYVRTRKRLSPNVTFIGAGIGKNALTVARWSMESGGHVRTGMEYNVRQDRDTLAPSNVALVRQVAAPMGEVGRRPATVAEARALLQLSP